MSENPNFRLSDYQIFLEEYSNFPLESLLTIARGDYNSIRYLENRYNRNIEPYKMGFTENDRKTFQKRLHLIVRLIRDRTGYQLKRSEIHTLRFLDTTEPAPDLPDAKKEIYWHTLREANEIKEKLLRLEAERNSIKD